MTDWSNEEGVIKDRSRLLLARRNGWFAGVPMESELKCSFTAIGLKLATRFGIVVR